MTTQTLLLCFCRLAHARALQSERLANESAEESDARLEGIRKRLANESSETRAARLERMKLAQHQRLATESSQERAERLESLHQNRDDCQETSLPLIEQRHVYEKMIKFHHEVCSIQICTCSTCLEKFPNMKLTSQHECIRCSRDKHSPKLYSAANNMSPGPVPPELQVSEYYYYTIVTCFMKMTLSLF